MSDGARPRNGPVKLEEERLIHALVSRALITAEEAEQCRADGPADAETLLARLVAAGSLTPAQARRIGQELPLLLAQHIPGYQVLEKLGQGAMGTVYKARQMSMNRLVAVKVLHPRYAASSEFLERLTREAHLAARLSHNNVVQAIDVGSAGKIHYFVMEYVEGKTIKQELEAGKVYPEKDAVDIVLQIAQALQHAHRRGLIHRDIKPANILLTSDGIAKLADLGMARETSDEALARREKGLSIGTPFYMAPEQIEGVEDIDVRADIYGLGATLYHMVTGQVPFPGKKVDEVWEAAMRDPLKPPDEVKADLSIGLGEVVEFMMKRKREERYQSPDDLVFDLERVLNGERPRLAYQRSAAATLAGLADGEEDEDDEAEPRAARQTLGLVVLGVLFGVSLLGNVLLLLRK